jgi:two-component system, NarL family, response regulator NreC
VTPSCHTQRLDLLQMQADTAPKSTFALLIADDHSLLREGLLHLFRQCGDIAAIGVEYDDVLSIVEHHNPDVVILGLGAKNDKYWPVVEILCESRPDTRILILDEAVRTRNIRRALILGIRGYWTKHAMFAQIVQAVRCLTAGRRSFCPEVDQYLYRTQHGLRYHPAHIGSPIQALTRRETELLTLLASGLTMKKCSERMGISINTVDNHKTRLMRKLGVHKTVELARLAVREGLIGEE